MKKHGKNWKRLKTKVSARALVAHASKDVHVEALDVLSSKRQKNWTLDDEWLRVATTNIGLLCNNKARINLLELLSRSEGTCWEQPNQWDYSIQWSFDLFQPFSFVQMMCACLETSKIRPKCAQKFKAMRDSASSQKWSMHQLMPAHTIPYASLGETRKL